MPAGFAACAGGPSFSELFDESAAAEGTGIQGAGLVRAVVILARYKATAHQREVAERNARRAVAVIRRQIAAEQTAVAPSKPAPKPAPGKPKPKPTPAAKVAKKKPQTKMPKKIAVKTVKDERTSPQAAASVMIYDVSVERFVGNEVYDIEREPPPGELVRFDSQVVRYVGVSGY